MDLDLDHVDHLLTTTRAVRKRLDLERPVPDDVLLDCLRLAVQAPTGSNRQSWRWLVVRDQAKKDALAELYNQGGRSYLEESAGSAEPGSQTSRVLSSALYLADHLAEVPVLVIPLILGRLDDGRTEEAAGLFGSIIPAMWSFQLALRSRGLGSCYTTLHLNREAEAAELLAIPDHLTQAGMLPVAYTRGTDFKPATRRPVEEITHLDTYENLLRPGP
jgi:nitroreductase